MTHEHPNQFRVRILHTDETEELSGWLNCQEQAIQAITGLRRSPGTAYWLQTRSVHCPHCPQRELTVVEFPLNLAGDENPRWPRQADRRLSGFASSRISSARA